MGKQANRRPSEPTHDGVPVEKIQEIADTIPETSVTIKRRNAKGELSGIGGFTSIAMKTVELLDIEKYIEESGLGGGQFIIEARNPYGTDPYFVAKFKIHREGAPLDPRRAANNPPGMYGGPPMPWGAPAPQMPPVPAQPPPQDGRGNGGWAAGLTPQDRAAYERSPVPYPYYPPPYPQQPAGIPADKLAVDQLNKLQNELGQLRAELAAERKRAEERNDQHLAKLEEMRREAEKRERELKEQHARDLQAQRDLREEDRRRHEEDQRRRADEERARERMELERRIAESQNSKGDRFLEMMLAMMKGNEGSKGNEMALQLKMIEMNQASTERMLTAMRELQQGASKADVLALEMLKQNSPEQKSMLLERTIEMQMTMAGAMVNLAQASVGENPPPWLELAMRGLDSIGGIVDSIRESNAPTVDTRALPRGNTRRLPAPQSNGAALPSPVSAKPIEMETIEIDEDEPTTGLKAQPTDEHTEGVPGASDPPDATEEIITPEEIDASVETDLSNPEREAVEAQIDKLAGMIPEDFRTVEWRTILIELHMQSDEVSDLATQHLEHLIRFKRLPKALARIQHSPEAAAQTLRTIFSFLPITRQAPEYVDAVIGGIVEFLVEDGFVATVTPGAEAPQPSA